MWQAQGYTDSVHYFIKSSKKKSVNYGVLVLTLEMGKLRLSSTYLLKAMEFVSVTVGFKSRAF